LVAILPAFAADARLDPLGPIRVTVAKGPVCPHDPLVEGHRPLNPPQEAAAEPSFKAVGVTDNGRQGDDLWPDIPHPSRAQDGQKELQVRSARGVGDHLHLVDDNGPDLVEEERIAEDEGRALLVRHQADVILPTHQRGDVVGDLSSGPDDA